MKLSISARMAAVALLGLPSAAPAQGFFHHLFGKKTKAAHVGSGFAASTDAAQTPIAPATPAPQTPSTPAAQPNVAVPTADAQQPTTDAPPPSTSSITVFSREVDLIFTVTNKKGEFVTGLTQDRFGLLDDGRPPQRVISFRPQTNLPLRVGIMLDTSSSIRQRFEFEQQAATDFFLQVLHPADRGFIEGFDVQTDIEQDFTNRIDLLDSGIRRLRPGGGTALFDSLYKTCRDQMLTLRDTTNTRKALVLVSDGDDNYSRATLEDAIKMCQRAETIVYTISTNTSSTKDKGDDYLQKIADATGGQAFFPTRLDDVATGFHNIEVEMRSQYSLIYIPANFRQDGTFRTIYLQSTDPRFNVRAKKGYFAPKAPE